MNVRNLITLTLIVISAGLLAAADETSKQTQAIMVLGAIKSPGPIPYAAQLTVQQAITAAGGPTRWADRQNVELRPGGDASKAVKLNLENIAAGKAKEPTIAAGDLIVIFEKKKTDNK